MTDERHAAEHTREDPQEAGFLSEFESPTYQQWRALVEEQLKGAPFEKKLITHTVENVPLQPIYLAEDAAEHEKAIGLPGCVPYVRGSSAAAHARRGWDIVEFLPYGTPDEVLAAAQVDLPRGLSAIHIAVDRATRYGKDPDEAAFDEVGACGTSYSTVQDFVPLVRFLSGAGYALHVDAGTAPLQVGALLCAAARQVGVALTGSVVGDPLAALATEGKIENGLTGSLDELAEWTRHAAENYPQLFTVGVDVKIYKDAGANAVQELGILLATGLEYLREFSRRELALEQVAPRMLFRTALGANFFMEIAKVRAARLLWSQLIALSGGNEAAQQLVIFGSTARWNKTKYGPYNNMLRATSETFAGVLGGCDMFEVYPFDEQYGLPDEFSRRIARNTQIVLKEETHAHSVIDAAGGSWYVETLTQQLAELGWKFFQEIERTGGMAKALAAGFVQSKIAEVAGERLKRLAERRYVAVGSNMYVNLKEDLPQDRFPDRSKVWSIRKEAIHEYRSAAGLRGVERALKQVGEAHAAKRSEWVTMLVDAASRGATIGGLTALLGTGNGSEQIAAAPLGLRRLTADYEALRATSTRLRAEKGTAPKVFLVTMGSLKQFKARADFSRTFFEPGGFEVLVNDKGFASVDDAVRAVLAADPHIAVICSTDENYPELVPPLVTQLKGGNPAMKVLLAGYPTDHVQSFKDAGIDDFIFLKSNNLEKLKLFQGWVLGQ